MKYWHVKTKKADEKHLSELLEIKKGEDEAQDKSKMIRYCVKEIWNKLTK